MSAPSGYKKFQNFTPEQMQLFEQMFSFLGPDSFLSQLASGDEGMFEQLEAPAFRQFSEMQGNLGSRFSGMGTGGQKSSGFQNTMNTAASNLAQDLQSQRMGLQNQAVKDLMGFSNQLMSQQPYSLIKKEHKPGFFEQLMKYGAPIVGGMVGGPAGAGIGAAAGNWWSNSGPIIGNV